MHEYEYFQFCFLFFCCYFFCLFDLLESLNRRSKLENPEQNKTRIPLDPKEAALEEAGAN